MALALGKFKSVAFLYRSDDDVTYRTIETGPHAVHALLVEWAPERLVVEVGAVTGGVHDIPVRLRIEIQAANPNTAGWRWKRVERRTDRDDALKLVRLSVLNQLPKVSMPVRRVRQWRSLIN